MTLAVTLCTVQVFFIDIIQCKQNIHMVWICVFTFFLMQSVFPKYDFMFGGSHILSYQLD